MTNLCRVCKCQLSEAVPELFDFPNITSDGRPWRKGRSVAMCPQCGLFQRVLAEGVSFTEVYEGYAGFKHGGDQINFNGTPQGRTTKILQELNLPEPKTVLDIGSGNGCGLTALREQWPSAAVTGFDPHGTAPGVLKEAPDGKFDLITMFHVLEHIEEPQEMLEYVRSRITGNGRFLIQVPYSLNWPFDFVIADHVWHFTQESLVILLIKAGFRSIKISNSIIGKEITAIAQRGRHNANIEVPKDELEGTNHALHWLIGYKQFLERIDKSVAVYGTGPAQAWAGYILGNKVESYYDDDETRYGFELNGKPIVAPMPSLPVVAPFFGEQYQAIVAKNPWLKFL